MQCSMMPYRACEKATSAKAASRNAWLLTQNCGFSRMTMGRFSPLSIFAPCSDSIPYIYGLGCNSGVLRSGHTDRKNHVAHRSPIRRSSRYKSHETRHATCSDAGVPEHFQGYPPGKVICRPKVWLRTLRYVLLQRSLAPMFYGYTSAHALNQVCHDHHIDYQHRAFCETPTLDNLVSFEWE